VDEQRRAFAGVMAIESRSRQSSRQPGRIVDGDGGLTWISEAQRLDAGPAGKRGKVSPN